MSTPKDAPYKKRQKSAHMVGRFVCAICSNKWDNSPLINKVMIIKRHDTKPRKFKVHVGCLKK